MANFLVPSPLKRAILSTSFLGRSHVKERGAEPQASMGKPTQFFTCCVSSWLTPLAPSVWLLGSLPK